MSVEKQLKRIANSLEAIQLVMSEGEVKPTRPEPVRKTLSFSETPIKAETGSKKSGTKSSTTSDTKTSGPTGSSVDKASSKVRDVDLVRSKLMTLQKATDAATARGLLLSRNAKRLKDLDESEYASIIEEADKLLAEEG